MKGLLFHQQQQQGLEENMSNLTSASGEASVSSGNRTEAGTNYPQQYVSTATPQTQPVNKKKRNLPGNPGLGSDPYLNTIIFITSFVWFLNYFYFPYLGLNFLKKFMHFFWWC